MKTICNARCCWYQTFARSILTTVQSKTNAECLISFNSHLWLPVAPFLCNHRSRYNAESDGFSLRKAINFSHTSKQSARHATPTLRRAFHKWLTCLLRWTSIFSLLFSRKKVLNKSYSAYLLDGLKLLCTPDVLPGFARQADLKFSTVCRSVSNELTTGIARIKSLIASGSHTYPRAEGYFLLSLSGGIKELAQLIS